MSKVKIRPPIAKAFEGVKWTCVQHKNDAIEIIQTVDDFDPETSTSTPWGMIVATVPIHFWLQKIQAFEPQLEQQLMNAAIIAMAPQLFLENQQLKARLNVLDPYYQRREAHFAESYDHSSPNFAESTYQNTQNSGPFPQNSGPFDPFEPEKPLETQIQAPIFAQQYKNQVQKLRKKT